MSNAYRMSVGARLVAVTDSHLIRRLQISGVAYMTAHLRSKVYP